MDIMLDLETLGTGSDCVILSIGAVSFNAVTDWTGDGYYRNITIFDQLMIGRKIETDTVTWWQAKAIEAREALLNPAPISLHEALGGLKQHLHRAREVENLGRPITGIWAKSPEFDCSILESAFKMLGMECPWTFRDRRDVRTAEYMGSLLPATFWKTPPEPTGVRHNALDDCHTQINAVQYYMQRMKLLTNEN